MLRTNPAYTIEDLKAKGFGEDRTNEELVEYYNIYGCNFPVDNLNIDGCFWVVDVTEPYDSNNYSNEWEITQVIASDETKCGYIFVATRCDKYRNGIFERKENITHKLIPENCVVI